jgi:hypothetical protein
LDDDTIFFSSFNKLFGMYVVKNMSYMVKENLKFVCDPLYKSLVGIGQSIHNDF